MAAHVLALLTLQERGAVTFDYGNNLRGQAMAAGVEREFEIGDFVPLFFRPLERPRAGKVLNDLVAPSWVKVPLVIGRASWIAAR